MLLRSYLALQAKGGCCKRVRRNLVRRLLAAYGLLLRRSLRITQHTHPATQELIDRRKPFLLCTWHGRCLLAEMSSRHVCPAHVAIVQSLHADGLAYAGYLQSFGYETIFGSAGRGTIGMLRGVLRSVARRKIVVITPDGPVGPRMRVKKGLTKMAGIAKVPLVPVAASGSWVWILPSWDRLALPFPFSRAHVSYDAPLFPPKRTDPQALADFDAKLEKRMNALVQSLDRRFGLPAVLPAPKP